MTMTVRMGIEADWDLIFALADTVDPPPDPLTEEKFKELLHRLSAKKQIKVRQIILTTNPSLPSWMTEKFL